MTKKFFFFDFDGTLAVGASGQVPEITRRTLDQLQENGHFVAMATGRLQADAIRRCEAIGIRHLVSDGGNGITLDGKLLSLDALHPFYSVKLLEELDAKGISWSITYNNTCTRYTRSEQFCREVQDTYMKTFVKNDLNFYDIKYIYKIYISCTQDMEKELSTLSYLPKVRFNPHCLFIEPDNKAKGIKKMMKHLNKPCKHVVVFGDGANDLNMFLNEWISIAMGNAEEQLKKKADFVTKNCDDGGIEYACSYFKWI